MKKTFGVFTVAMLTVTLLSCGNNAEDIVSKAEYDAVVSNLNSRNAELQTQLESVQAELNALKESIEEAASAPEKKSEEVPEIKEDEGLTVATDPITVPDPSTQSEFVVELTAENFMSVFEFIAVNEYDVWGEYSSKCFGFSSLLYEQGWALGKVEDFAVEYSVFGESKVTDTNPTAGKPLGYGYPGENEDPDLHIYRAKGTVTFYPIEDVNDTVRVYDSIRYIVRVMPDGSEEWLYTDMEGIMVY